MPLYEFRCEKCRKKFTLKVSVTEYEKKRPACPKCKSRKASRIFSPVITQTDTKS